MIPLYEQPHFAFFFAEGCLIPRFHLEGAVAGQRVAVHRVDAISRERCGLLAFAVVGAGGWVDLPEPIVMQAGEGFRVDVEPATLCERCGWMRPITTPRGSRFLLCERSTQDARFPKYPRQPLTTCTGFEPGSHDT